MALPCPLQAFGLHSCDHSIRLTDGALFFPTYFSLRLSTPGPAGLYGGFRLDPAGLVHGGTLAA